MKDQLHRTLNLKATPIRLVSLVPSLTELLVDLGLEASIVGITKFCEHPKYLLKTKTVVGGTKQVHSDKIRALQPDIILCNKEENTQEIIADLASIAPIHMSDIYNLQDCFELISMYGELFKVESKASELILNIQKERDAFQNQFRTKKQPKVAYFIWKNPWMVAASDTFINVMLSEAGFTNIFKDEKRYPEIDLSHSKLNAVDFIFLSSEPFPFKGNHVEEFRSQFPDKTITIVDGDYFSWYGSRLLGAYRYFKTLHNRA